METGTASGEVVSIDYDRDTIVVRMDGEDERTLSFELFDASDIFQPGQRFTLSLDESGQPLAVLPGTPRPVTQVPGYVESVDMDDELVWVYLRDEEGWHRKVIPLELFIANGLAHPGRHFFLETDEDGTPIALEPDEQELEMKLQPAEQAKPRWTSRPAAEAE